MKRFATLALALALVLAACGDGAGAESTTTTEASTTTTTSTSTTTTTTVPEVSVQSVVCGALFESEAWAVPGLHTCEGDSSYASMEFAGFPLVRDSYEVDGQTVYLEETLFDVLTETMIFQLGFSGSVEARIQNTRALDGTQTAESPDGYVAYWTYHPDDGLNIVIEESSD